MPCPYYRQVQLEGRHSWVHGYCEADATGRLRVPSLSEDTHYCINERYEDCPLYQSKQVQPQCEETHVHP